MSKERKIEGTIHCECKECDFNENSKCTQSYISIDDYDHDNTITHINNLKSESKQTSYRILIDKDGCNVFLDKWDEIESRDRID